jgi:hypothetical protein
MRIRHTCRRAGDLVVFDRKRKSRLRFFIPSGPRSGAGGPIRRRLTRSRFLGQPAQVLPDMLGEYGETARCRLRDVAFPHRSALFECPAERRLMIAKHLERQEKIPEWTIRIEH